MSRSPEVGRKKSQMESHVKSDTFFARLEPKGKVQTQAPSHYHVPIPPLGAAPDSIVIHILLTYTYRSYPRVNELT